ncbi:hypothetical protein LA52FAK_30600 [Desulforhopalus sp. 52FAK]
MNSLVHKPEFYNALTHNCTTTIQIHANATWEDAPPLDWRFIASGHVDELFYDRGVIQSDLASADLGKLSRVDLKIQQEGEENFSAEMREYIKSSVK